MCVCVCVCVCVFGASQPVPLILGVAGPRGATGSQGPRGLQGSKGEKGDPSRVKRGGECQPAQTDPAGQHPQNETTSTQPFTVRSPKQPDISSEQNVCPACLPTRDLCESFITSSHPKLDLFLMLQGEKGLFN